MWTGLLGFREIRTRAGIAAGLIEVAAFGVLALAAIAVGPAAQADGSVSRTARLVEQARAALSRAIGVVGAVSVAALLVRVRQRGRLPVHRVVCRLLAAGDR